MATLVEFTVSTDEFPLGRLFTAVPGATVELERLVPIGDAAFPYAWVRDADRADVAAALEASTTTETGITTAQPEALELAYERGYFDDPRRVTLGDLATELEITRQSLAGRLRRGHRDLLAQLFGAGERSSASAFTAE